MVRARRATGDRGTFITYTCVCREYDREYRMLGTPEVVRVESTNAESAGLWAQKLTGLPIWEVYLGNVSDSWLKNHNKL